MALPQMCKNVCSEVRGWEMAGALTKLGFLWDNREPAKDTD
jgi:hypothetical protein